MSNGSIIIPLSKSIPASYWDDLSRPIVADGIINNIIMAFAAGCHQLVDVRVLYKPKNGSATPIVPSHEDAFISLDNYTISFDPEFEVERGSKIVVEWYNYDSINSHTVPVIVQVKRKGSP